MVKNQRFEQVWLLQNSNFPNSIYIARHIRSLFQKKVEAMLLLPMLVKLELPTSFSVTP
jgi:hypothetical protein